MDRLCFHLIGRISRIGPCDPVHLHLEGASAEVAGSCSGCISFERGASDRLHGSRGRHLVLVDSIVARSLGRLHRLFIASVDRKRRGRGQTSVPYVDRRSKMACNIASAALRRSARRGVASVKCATTSDVAAREATSHVSGDAHARVRFAPSPTGQLHVGGARTALFNWLFARRCGGKFVVRIEDTDAARSTKESEDAMVKDLQWLGLDWDEGPQRGGERGPYRQSERKEIYRKYVDVLVEKGLAYPCFCTDDELEAMKKEAEENKMPPVYNGKWAHASQEEVESMINAGVPYCYRFRVPKDKVVDIDDIVRGKVSWNTNTLGDFVVLRSNGLPVYNFCVAIDDGLMGISHVVRAEEHLPNTLRQVLIYEALDMPQPVFAHVSLILAPDRSKLSKRHGATSVGQFREMGYLPDALVNYLALLGWNDGTEKEIFTLPELVESFTLDRVTKSAAVFDIEKLKWMNGQHLRALPEESIVELIGQDLVEAGIAKDAGGQFCRDASLLLQNSCDLVADSRDQLQTILQYEFLSTVASDKAAKFVEDDFKQVVEAVISAYESKELLGALENGESDWKTWVKATGKALNRKGKRLFMPLRIALTGCMEGPDVGAQLMLLSNAKGAVTEGTAVVDLDERIRILRDWLQKA